MLDLLVYGKASITRRIQNSPVLSSIFAKFVQESEANVVSSGHVRNLQMRKHRFDSVLRPLGRFILHLEAVLQTAVWIAVQRRGEPQGREAEAFLAGISEAHVLLAGMCADAAHESIILVRFLDTEEHDVAEVPVECAAYISKLHYLFNEASLQCCQLAAPAHLRCRCSFDHDLGQHLPCLPSLS